MQEDDRPQHGISRRRFLKGAGVSVVGTALVPALSSTTAAQAPPPLEAASPAGLRRYAAAGERVTLTVNGKAQQVEVTPATTLLAALRERLDLTGAKEGCDRGACGACTVLLDGRPINSCMTLALDAVGHRITTVEGLANDAQLDGVQQAFVDHDAAQCGYCIPGFVVSARGLLDQTPQPNRDQIERGLCGNICRCAAYVRIFDAVEAAATPELKGGRP